MVIRVGGGNRHLEPERARTLSASLAFHPQALPGLEMELTGFRIDYTDRVVQPITNYAQVMGTPFYDQLVNYQPTAEDQERIISNTKFNTTGTVSCREGVCKSVKIPGC